MLKSVCGLDELIKRTACKPSIIQPLADVTTDGVPIVYRAICYFHLYEYEPKRAIPVNSFAFQEGRFIDKEDSNGEHIIRYGVCSPCAERRGLVYRRPDDET